MVTAKTSGVFIPPYETSYHGVVHDTLHVDLATGG
jgi:hypothetical protein